MQFTNRVSISRPVPQVFAYLADFENIPQWNYAISRTRKVTSGPVGVGSRYVQQRTVPSVSEEAFDVIAYEPNRMLSIRGRLGPLPTEATYVVEPAGDATVLTNTMDVEPQGLTRVLAPLATARLRAAVGANLGRLKELLESS
jgi:uncharacterized protein YndB with AHSA1/START domain